MFWPVANLHVEPIINQRFCLSCLTLVAVFRNNKGKMENEFTP